MSAVNLLTTVLNDTPLMPDDDGIDMDWLVSSADASQWFRDEDDEDDDRKVSAPVYYNKVNTHCIDILFTRTVLGKREFPLRM